MNIIGKKRSVQLFALLVIVLFLNMPIVSALQISGVRAEDVTQTGAVIKWNTDEPADSFVSYGTDAAALQTIGDANQIVNHSLALTTLNPQTAYKFKVESAGTIDDNGGSLYSFSTPAPDTTAPELKVELPPRIAGAELSVEGTVEAGAAVTIYVGGSLAGSTTAIPSTEGEATSTEGTFTFASVVLTPDQDNTIKIEATDRAGNVAGVEGTVFADSQKPVVEIGTIPEIASENSIEMNGTISEPATFEIFVNEKSVAKGEGQTIQEMVRLDEGKNTVKIVVKDLAGWEVTKEFEVSSDTQPPHVTFKFEEGNEYYQGRADTNINGETEPGAEVFLYVYRPLGYEYTPKFDKAWAKTTADENGDFTFDVDFEDEPVLELLKGLKPKQVPSGLQEYSIFSTAQVAEQQQFTYYVFVIAEDKSGKSGFLQQTVNVNTCFSGNFDFDVQSVAYLQAPLRLDPRLLDEGRETITATFNMSYRGNGRPDIDRASGREIKPGFDITGVEFEKACTQGMQNDDSFKVSCQILPAGPQVKQSNSAKTAWFVSYNLHGAADMSEKKDDFWNEFKKRRIVFPLKVRVSYRERDGVGNYGPPKTQTSCIDLGYFIDIPVDSKDMLPDFIADEVLTAITKTIEKIDAVLPYLEKAIIVTGIGAISTFLLKMTVRWARITTSKLESYFSDLNPDKKTKKCPTNQDDYHLRSTIEDWTDLESKRLFSEDKSKPKPLGNAWKEKVLDDACPNTAALWKTEAVLDQGLKWTWDRFFCRAVPAAWTSKQEKKDVDAVIISQNQCTASTRGIPLKLVENCQERVAKDVTVTVSESLDLVKLKRGGAFPCYENPVDNQLYYFPPEQSQGAVDKPKVVELKWIAPTTYGLDQAFGHEGNGQKLFAFKPPNSKDVLVGTQQTCDELCKNPRRTGFKADAAGGVQKTFYQKKPGNYGCYKEVSDSTSPGGIRLQGSAGFISGEDKFPAGMYTADCFVNVDADGKFTQPAGETGLLQCVCAPDKEAKPPQFGAREAIKETKEGVAEKWDYREETIFKKTGGAYGTYYPEWRYYKGRDFSSAFGQNYLPDSITPGDHKEHKVDPFTQHISTFQTMCLTGVRARLITLRSILEGLRGCIQEAKVTGLHDAGMCKTIFSQQVCGLIYKSIAYFFTSCSPHSFTDGTKGKALDDIGAIFQAGFSSIPEAMQDSITDAQSDYHNAKLNEFFATGTQGFAQSICMAAFGYDWPMGMDFITDAAYAFPTKTNVVVMPAGRELSTYNPMRGTAIFNYEVGVTIIPGCKIKSYDVSLKCVGPEDKGHPGIQCGTQGCDCLQATERSGVENEKTKLLDGGRGFDLRSGQVFSPAIPAPQKVDMNYKYDHVVVHLELGPYESPDTCFDDGYKDGLFYFPITDISAPGEAVCQVQPFTGRYTCPALLSQFGGGSGAYLEDPFVSCFDKNTNTWARCNTPNLFIKGDPIKIKAQVVTDAGKFCLDTKVSGITADPRSEIPRDLAENSPGSHGVEIPLGTVDESMLGSTENTLIRDIDSDSTCSSDITFVARPSGNINTKSYRFNFAKGTDGKYAMRVDAGITIDVANSKYTISNLNKIVEKNNPAVDISLTADELKLIPFLFDGFKVQGLIGAPSGIGGKNSCVYRSIHASGAGLTQNQRSFSVTVRVMQPDAGGSCFNPTVIVRAPAYGEASHTETIIIQRESVVTQVASRLHQEFLNNNCQYVQEAARRIINLQQSDMEDASALYYSIACYIIQGGVIAADGTGWTSRFKTEIGNLLTIFFKRQYNDGTTARPYVEKINTNTAEYKKMENYLCCVAEKLDKQNEFGACAGKSCLSGSGATASTAPPPK